MVAEIWAYSIVNQLCHHFYFYYRYTQIQGWMKQLLPDDETCNEIYVTQPLQIATRNMPEHSLFGGSMSISLPAFAVDVR